MKKTIALLAAAAVSLTVIPLAACAKNADEKRSLYTVNAAYDEGARTLSGTVKLDYYNSTDNEITELCFNLWGNAFRKDAAYSPVSSTESAKAYYSGASFGEEKVEKVENCASWEVGGEDENILKVNLNQPVYPEQTASVTITYSLTLAKVNHRTGVSQSAVNLGNFYPVLCAYTAEGFAEYPYYSCGDPFVSECADYDVTLTLPCEYVAATSGKVVSSSKAGDTCTQRYELKNARDFAAVVSKDFKTLTRKVGNTEVNVYYRGESKPEKALNAAAESLEYFSQTFGEYAYPTLSVAFTGLCVAGMEYPALTMIGDGQTEETRCYTVVHEVAHQWWYAMVGSDQVKESWQDEGLAEYSTLCFFEAHPEYGFTRTQTLGAATKAYRAYYSVYNQLFGKANTEMSRKLGDFASDYEYVNVAYNKGLLMFETLRTSMGDEKFFSALKSYFENYKFSLASKECLIGAFTSRHDVGGLIEAYLGGKVII